MLIQYTIRRKTALAHATPAREPKHILGGDTRAQSWLSGEKTSWSVVVHGYKENKGEPISGISKGITTILNGPDSNAADRFPMMYFCGLHPESSDATKQAISLMRSLLAQLLKRIVDQQLVVDLKDISDYHLRNAMKGEIDGLLYVFEGVIERLPEESIIHCVVDNIEQYYIPGLQQSCGAGLVIPTLKRAPTSKKVFKKLVFTTGPDCSIFDPWSKHYFVVPWNEIHGLDVDRPE